MKKTTYNLAGDRRVDKRAFAWRAGVLAAAALALGGLAAAGLARQNRADLGVRSATRREQAQAGAMRAESLRMQEEIAAWKKTWAAELAAANHLIERKSFSFVSRFDLLERVFRSGLRIQHVTMANEATGLVTMTVSAGSLRDLFELYKKLAPYELAISNEVQSQGEYQVNLSFRIPNEKI
jgi:hypothetical protein